MKQFFCCNAKLGKGYREHLDGGGGGGEGQGEHGRRWGCFPVPLILVSAGASQVVWGSGGACITAQQQTLCKCVLTGWLTVMVPKSRRL